MLGQYKTAEPSHYLGFMSFVDVLPWTPVLLPCSKKRDLQGNHAIQHHWKSYWKAAHGSTGLYVIKQSIWTAQSIGELLIQLCPGNFRNFHGKQNTS